MGGTKSSKIWGQFPKKLVVHTETNKAILALDLSRKTINFEAIFPPVYPKFFFLLF